MTRHLLNRPPVSNSCRASDRPAAGASGPRIRTAGGYRLLRAAAALLLALPAVIAAPSRLPAAETGRDAFEAAFQFTLGKMLAEESSFDEALEAFERSVDLDGSDAYAHIELAKFHLYISQISRTAETRRRHLERAALLMDEARNALPENLDVLRQYGLTNLRFGEDRLDALDRAQEAFEILHQRTAGDLQVLASLGQIYLWKREPARAAEVLREAAGQLPNQRGIQAMLAEALLSSEQYEEAEETLERLITLVPDSLDYRMQLAELRSQRGDHRAAVEVLRGAPPSLLDVPRLRHSLARELHLAGANDQALATVDALIEEVPDSLGLRRLRIAVLTSMARYSEAIAELEPLLDDEQNNRRLQDSMLLSRLLERVGRSEEAARHLRDLLVREPEAEQLELKVALAGILERRSLTDQAAEVLAEEVKTAGPDQLAVLAPTLSQLLERAGRHDEAWKILADAIRALSTAAQPAAADGLRLRQLMMLANRQDWSGLLDAASSAVAEIDADLRPDVEVLRAEALSQLDRVPEALELLQIDGEASDPEVRRRLAQRSKVFFDHDRGGEARELLSRIAAGGEPDDLFFAARIYQRSSKYEDVVPLMERLLEQRPDSLQGLFLLGAAHERLGQHKRGAETFRRLLSIDPDHAPTLNYLGYMWAERGENLDEALGLILRAVAIDPDNGAYVDSLGWTYYQLGRYEEARGHLEWAARLVPGDPTVFEHLGDLYLVLDDVDRARGYYRHSLELSGDNVDEVRRKLQSLEDQGL